MKKIHWKKAQLFVAISLLFVATLFLFNDSGITGHVTADFRSQTLNLAVEQSQMFSLTTNQAEPIYISSFRMSGEVIGGGSVEAYIESNGERLLIFKNVKEREQGLPSVTGLAVAAEPPAEEALLLLNYVDTLEWKEETSLSDAEEFIEGSFNNQCKDTCFIEMSVSSEQGYRLIFMIEPGTKLNIHKIIYTLKNKNI